MKFHRKDLFTLILWTWLIETLHAGQLTIVFFPVFVSCSCCSCHLHNNNGAFSLYLSLFLTKKGPFNILNKSQPFSKKPLTFIKLTYRHRFVSPYRISHNNQFLAIDGPYSSHNIYVYIYKYYIVLSKYDLCWLRLLKMSRIQKSLQKNGGFLARVLCDNLHPRNSPLKQPRQNECLEPECLTTTWMPWKKRCPCY